MTSLTLIKKYFFPFSTLSCLLLINIYFIDFFKFEYFKMIIWNASLFLLISLGISTAKKTDNLNLGSEGQIYLGTLLAYYFSKVFNLNYFNFIPVLLSTAFLVSLIGLLIAYIKYYFSLSELVVSLLSSYGLIKLTDGIIVKLQKGERFLMQTESINNIFNIDSFLWIPALSSLSLLLIFIFVYEKTSLGALLKVLSDNINFKSYFNINLKKLGFSTLFISAFLNGIVATFFVIFYKHNLFLGISSSLGWSGFIVALLANFNFFYLIFFSLFLAFLYEFNSYLILTYNFSYNLYYLYLSFLILVFLFFNKKGS